MNLDVISAFIGFILTVMVLSYVISDNILFRVAVSLFVGVSAGFAGAVALRNVIYPTLIQPLVRVVLGSTLPQDVYTFIPLVLAVLLLLKLSKNLGRAGNVAMAYLVGVGAAVAIGGALLGTLFPQTAASMDLLNLNGADFQTAATNPLIETLSRLIAVIGTLATLIYFHFGVTAGPEGETPDRQPWLEWVGKVGQGFIAITFGVMFAGVYSAAIVALIDRVDAVIQIISFLISPS